MSKKKTDVDADLPRLVADADVFIASMFKGRGQYEKVNATTLDEARKAGAALEAASVTGRKAMIYVLHAGRQVLVPATFVMPDDNGLPECLDRKKNPVSPPTEEERTAFAGRTPSPVAEADAAHLAVVKEIDDQIARQKKTKQANRIARLLEKKEVQDIPEKYRKWDVNISKFVDARQPKPKKEDVMSAKLKVKTNGKVKPAVKSTARRKPEVKKVATPRAKPTGLGKRMTNADRAAIEEAAKKGKLPPAPDFSADTHKPWRKKLTDLVALAGKRDVKGLKAYWITDQKNPSTSPKALGRYRDLCVTALQAKK